MGAWGVKAFDNDTACNWAGRLKRFNSLSYIEAVFNVVDAAGDDFIRADDACKALAACEVLARLLGRPGYQNPYTKQVDEWAAECKLTPPPALVARASSAIDRVLGENSELRQLWNEGDGGKWHQAVEELRIRLDG